MLATLTLKLNFVARNFSRILQGSAEEMLGIEKYFSKTTSSENVKIGGAKIMFEKICNFYSV